MAITIKLEPQTFQSAFNEVMVVLDSDKKTESKFQYLVDINIDGVFSSRLKIQSNPQGFGVMNIAKHLESYVTGYLNVADKKTFKVLDGGYALYNISLKEEYVLISNYTTVTNNGGFCQYNFTNDHGYSDADFITIVSDAVFSQQGVQLVTSIISSTSVVTNKVFDATDTGTSVFTNGTVTVQDSATTFTEDKFVLNNVVNWVDVPNWNSDNYELQALNDSLLLSTLPKDFAVSPNERHTMNFYNGTTNDASFLEVTTSRGTFRIDNTYSTSINATKFLSIGVGIFDLENTTDTVTVVSGSLPMFDSSVTDYSIHLTNATFVRTSKIHTFKTNYKCSDFDGVDFIYQNRDGSFSTFRFALNSTKKVSVRKKSYKQSYGSYNSTANTYGWNTSDLGITRLDTKVTELYTAQSDYLTQEDGNLIQELIASPEVYKLEKDNTTLDTPVAMNEFTNTVGGLVQLTTSANHNMVDGDMITLQGFAESTMSGSFKVNEIVNTTSLIIEKGATINGYNCVSGESIAKEIFLSDGLLMAVEIKTSNVKIKTSRTDGLIAYKIDYLYSTNNKTQR